MALDRNSNQLYATYNILKILSNIDELKEWDSKDTFFGYKYLIESSFKIFLNHLSDPMFIELKTDEVYNVAHGTGVRINKFPNTCEKTIFIRNIIDFYYPIKKSKNFKQLKTALDEFQNNIGMIFDKVFDKYIISANDEITKEEGLNYLTQFYTYIFLVDFSLGQPKYSWNFFIEKFNEKPDEDFLNKAFYGYKRGLQYVWKTLLGDKYFETSITNLVNVKHWNKPEDSIDSYFEIIREEIINPLELKGQSYNFTRENFLTLNKKVPKALIKQYLIEKKKIVLSLEDQLNYLLLWAEIEIMDNQKSGAFNGIPFLYTVLLGVIQLNKERKREIRILRFKHPVKFPDKVGYDYSYALFISPSLPFVVGEGWALFMDCCTDYSGYGGGLYRSIEEKISECEKKKLVKIQELEISRKDLISYLKIDSYLKERLNNTEHLKVARDDYISIKKELEQALAIIIELISYYTLSQHYKDIDWDIKVEGGQIDIMYRLLSEICLVECKINPYNNNIEQELLKLKTKKNQLFEDKNLTNSWNIDKNTKFRYEFWFWYPITEKTLKLLEKNNCQYYIISEMLEKEPIWRQKTLKKTIKHFFETISNSYSKVRFY